MPKITGLDLQEMLSHRDEHLQIIFLTGQADIETSVRAMKAGAVDFLTKPFDDHQFLSAIRNALALSEQTLAKQDEIKRDREAFVSLSPREREVCIRIAEGFLNKQVGFELGTSEKTIKAQRASVMQKLGARSLPDVVRLVERLRIAGTFPAASNPPRT
jgi:FixJ family two-component response regulator